MSYRLSKSAERDLIDIYLEGVRSFGFKIADEYSFQLESIFETLSNHPNIARERLEITPPVRVHPFRSHMIIYETDAIGVLILRIRHHRENWIDDPV